MCLSVTIEDIFRPESVINFNPRVKPSSSIATLFFTSVHCNNLNNYFTKDTTIITDTIIQSVTYLNKNYVNDLFNLALVKNIRPIFSTKAGGIGPRIST